MLGGTTTSLTARLADHCHTTLRPYKTGTTILFQGEVPAAAFCVKNGFISAYTINNNGDEQIIGFFAAGDMLPAEWLFDHSPVALYYYQAFTDCELLRIPRDELRDEINHDADLSRELLDRYVSSYIGATIHIHALEHSHSREKLIKLFHYLVLRFGKPLDDKREHYNIPFLLTHTQLASMIGLTRETVAIETVKLKKTGAVRYKNGAYTVNLPQLIKTIGSEEFDALQL